jgi:hypothetical protein
LKLSTFSTVVPSMWIGGCTLCCFLASTMICDVKWEVVSPHLFPVGCLIIVGNQAYYCCVIWNLMIELETCLASQSWMNREYRRGLSTHPCGAPVLRISEVEVLFPTIPTWGGPSGYPGPSCTGRASDRGPQT